MHFRIRVAYANTNTSPYKPRELRGPPGYLIALVLIYCDLVVKFKEINHKHSYTAICQTHLCIIVVNVSSLSN